MPDQRNPIDLMLQLRTLGGVAVRRADGGQLGGAASQRRSLALLSLLAGDIYGLHVLFENIEDNPDTVHGEGLRRDRILALLWPDGDPERSRHALTQSLYHIRKALDCDDLFITAGGDVRLNPARMASDVAQFEAFLARGEDQLALLLYEGPFLEGLVIPSAAEFDQWASAQRTRLLGLATAACKRLADAAEARGDWPGSVRALTRKVALDPFNGRATMALMRATWATGDRAGAIQQGMNYTNLLREQLEIEPDTAMLKLIAELRNATDTPSSVELDATIVDEPRERVPAPSVPPAVVQEDVPEDAPTVAPPRKRWWRRPATFGAVAALIVAVVAWGVRAQRGRSVPSAAKPIVVAPFRVSGADQSLAYLREGMVELLSTRLADDSAARAVDPGLVLRALSSTGGRGADTPQRSAVSLAGRLGAGRVITGSVVGSAEKVIISASILSVETGEQTAQANVEGPADSITTLVNRLAARLLASNAGEGDRLNDRLTPSLAALHDFLEGQAAYRRGDYASAIPLYERALTRDSTFALAALQLALSADRQNDAEQHDRALSLAWANRGMLNERDRAHLTAFAGPRYPAPSLESEQVAAWEHAVAVAPDRADVWYELGERLVRVGAVVGMGDAHVQAKATLLKALELDPGHQPTRRLLIMLAARQNDTTLLRRIASPKMLRDSVGPLSGFLRWRVALALGDSTELRKVRGSLGSMNEESLRSIAMSSLNDAVGLDDGETAARLLAQRAANVAGVYDALMAQHTLALNEGRPTVALRLTEQIHEAQPASHAHLRLRVLDALYGEGDRAAASAAADSIASSVDAPLDQNLDARSVQLADACVEEQWRLRQGRTTTAKQTIARLRAARVPRQPIPVSASQRACALILEAQYAVIAKQPDAAEKIASLDSLMLSGPAVSDASTYANIVLAHLYETMGNQRAALAAFRRRSYMTGWPRYLATIRREEAQIAARLGDTEIARTSFARYLAIRRHAEPVLATTVDTVRSQALALNADQPLSRQAAQPASRSLRRFFQRTPVR